MNNNMLLLKNKSVLLAEDDTAARTGMEEKLEVLFARVYSASDGEEAYKIYKKELPDIIIADLKMPHLDGLGLIGRIREKDYMTPIVVLTGFVEPQLLLDATNLAIDGYLLKPVDLEQLTSTLCTAMKRNGAAY